MSRDLPFEQTHLEQEDDLVRAMMVILDNFLKNRAKKIEDVLVIRSACTRVLGASIVAYTKQNEQPVEVAMSIASKCLANIHDGILRAYDR